LIYLMPILALHGKSLRVHSITIIRLVVDGPVSVVFVSWLAHANYDTDDCADADNHGDEDYRHYTLAGVFVLFSWALAFLFQV
jgi:hypothetical protein